MTDDDRYESAVEETQMVLAEWLMPCLTSDGTNAPWGGDLGKAIVDRLVAKGVIRFAVESALDQEKVVNHG